MVGSWYHNIPGFLHLDLVILDVNTSKSYAAVAKEVHQFWTMLVTTAKQLKWKNVNNKRGRIKTKEEIESKQKRGES